MRKCLEVANNLFLGDRYSVPKDADVVLACAEEIFLENINNPNISEKKDNYFYKVNQNYYLNFLDYPSLENISDEYLRLGINIIHSTLQENKKIYIHCYWGINRSASLVFIYLVKSGLLNNDDLQAAINQYHKIYPYFSPNPGWKEYIYTYYPFSNLSL